MERSASVQDSRGTWSPPIVLCQLIFPLCKLGHQKNRISYCLSRIISHFMPWKFSLANQSIMFLMNIIYRKLSSLLQPWLQDEPELELKLGFIKSHAILKNLTLNSLCINQLLDEESSNSLCVKEVKVKELILRFSHWSSTAFSFEIRGLHVTLSAR